MTSAGREYRFLVRTRRLVVPGLLDTWSDHGPAVQTAMDKIAVELKEKMDELDGEGWTIVSHSAMVHGGLIIASFLLSREVPPAPPA
jgi:hypothetical protein